MVNSDSLIVCIYQGHVRYAVYLYSDYPSDIFDFSLKLYFLAEDSFLSKHILKQQLVEYMKGFMSTSSESR